MFKTIRTRFVVSAVAFILICVGIPTFILLTQFKENFNQRSVMMLESTVDILRYGLHTAMMQGNQKNIEQVLKKINETHGVRHIRIFNKEGVIRFSSEPDEKGIDIIQIDPEHIHLKDINKESIRLVKPEGVYTITEPIKNGEECQGCHIGNEPIDYLDVDTELTTAEVVFYTGSKHMIFMGIAVVIILLTGLYFIFSYFISHPLNKLNNALKIVETGSLEIELPANRKDEIGSVFRRFNLMTSKLKSSRDEIAELHFEQLQRANRLKMLGELTSEMAHEINNHTAIVMSRADYLNLESGNMSGLNQYVDDFKVILDQTEKISTITNNILRHSKKSLKKRESINVVDTIIKTLQLVQPLMEKNNIRLKLDLGNEKPFINGDSLEIEQVLINLLKNSIDAIEKNGEIKIKLSRSLPENKFAMEITDDGCGIDKERLSQIFSPFYTSKSQDKGTGLGLYIVQNICKNHKIDITVNSEIEKGTSFKLIFNEIG
jgi:signal transduction histidine kinase